MTDPKLTRTIAKLVQQHGFLGVGKALLEAMPADRRLSLWGTCTQLRLDDDRTPHPLHREAS